MKPTPHQVLLLKLQHVMAFLLYSFRSVYSPAAFVSLSRPPWFETGRQQDCSEYLRYVGIIIECSMFDANIHIFIQFLNRRN